jgi:hypothetical protein
MRLSNPEHGTNFRRSKIDDIHKTMIPKQNSARSSTFLVHKPNFFNFSHPPRCRFSSFHNSKPSHYRYTMRRNRQMEWKIGTKLQRPSANSGNVDDGVRFQHNFHSQFPSLQRRVPILRTVSFCKTKITSHRSAIPLQSLAIKPSSHSEEAGDSSSLAYFDYSFCSKRSLMVRYCLLSTTVNDTSSLCVKRMGNHLNSSLELQL